MSVGQSIEEYAKENSLTESQVWSLVMSGKIPCRQKHGLLLIYSQEPQMEALALPSSTTHSPNETQRRLSLIEKKLDSIIPQEAQTLKSLQNSIKEKDERIKRLMHDLEDLSILSSCLQEKLSGR